MQITVYKNFSKRINSTKVPASGGTTLSVVIKDYSNIETPSFTLTVSNIDQNSGFLDINYVEAFGRKYFATCNVETSTSFSIDCTLDHLATFKSEIQGYTGLVEYTSASDRLDILDPRNPPTINIKESTIEVDPGWITYEKGTYIFAVASSVTSGAGGAPAYYVCSESQLTTIMQDVFDTGVITQLENQFFGVTNSMISCLWLPFNYSFVHTCTDAANIGNVIIGNAPLANAQADIVLTRTWSYDTYIPLSNPESYSGTYVQSASFMDASIYLPGVGVCPFDFARFANHPGATQVKISINLDLLTGDIVYYLGGGPGTTGSAVSYSGNVAAKVPLAGMSYDAVGMAGGLIATIGSVFTGSIGGVVSGLSQTIESTRSQSMILGSNSSPLALLHDSKIRLHIVEHEPVVHNSLNDLLQYRSELGMPFYEVATLSSLSGYIKCYNASVSIPGNGAEQATVNGFLNGGFYLE